MAGKVVLITGTSGSGKSTSAAAFANRASEPYLKFGMDQLVGMMFPSKFALFGERSSEGYNDFQEDPNNPGRPLRSGYLGSMGWTGMRAMHEMIAAGARSGQNMVIDHLLFVDPPILQDLIWRLQGLPVWLIGLKPPYEVLAKRVLGRGGQSSDAPRPAVLPEGFTLERIKKIGEHLNKVVPWYYEALYENECFDLLIDSEQNSPEQVAEQIERRVEQGPGAAVEQLRQRYPKSAATS